MSTVILGHILYITTIVTFCVGVGVRGNALDVASLYSIGNYGQTQCLRLCGRTSACLSYSYYRVHLTCVLYGADTSTQSLIHDSDAVFQEKSSFPLDSLGPCGALSCPGNSECVKLSNGPPICVISACTAPPGAVSGAIFTTDKAVHRVTDTLSFTCNAGLALSGNPNVTCKASGTWTQPDFSCAGCPSTTPSLANGAVTTGDTSIGTVRTYTCDSGYTSGGSDVTSTCTSAITWSAVVGTCSAVDCGQPPALTGGSIDSSATTTYPISRTYTCNTGYTPNSGSGTISCQASGSWTSPSLTCTIVDCGEPTVSEANGVVNSGCTFYECPRMFSCASGYDIGGSVFGITCQASGAWSGSSYSCTPVDCGQPPALTGGSIDSLATTTYQASRTYTCNTGYTPNSGSGTISCQASRSWSSPSLICTVVDCGEPTVSEANGVVNSGCTFYECPRMFSCASGYDIGGSVFAITCQASGAWSGSSYSCTPAAVTCPAHPIKAYTKISGTGTAEGSTITYTCDDGAILATGTDPATSTCTAQGAWSTAAITCTKCSSYATTYIQRTSWFFNPPVSFTPSISGGSVTASYCANACNTRTDFVCVAYYYRKSTGSYCVLRPMRVHDDTNHQQYDNADTAYDEYIRECVPPCPDPPYIAYTSVSGTGSSRTYTCDTGATLTSGDNPATATCTAGVWSNANIQCTKCSSYATTYIQRTSRFFNPPVSFTPSISGGSVTASYCANACNTRTDFVCVAYYYRKSTGSYCVLRPMRVHDDTNHQQYDNADTAYDEYIRECVPPCPDPPYIAYTSVSGTGSSRTYTCDTGATLTSGDNPATATCTAGVWSNANIQCTKCSSYATTYIQRTSRFFNPPVSFTPSISGGSVTASYCANACNTRTDFVCVAYYYRKSTGSYCVLRPMRVHDDTNHQQYDNADTAYDEYIRKCVPPCPDPPYIAYTSVSGTGSSRTYTCDTGATLTSGDNPATATCTAGVWSNANIQCTKCSWYATTYIQRTSRFFNPPVSFTPSISGGSVTASYCANACNTRTDFVCVAYYYRKSTGSYCVLRPMRVHDDTNHQQYDNADTAYDEYIRECAAPPCPDPPYIAYTSVSGTGSSRTYTCDTGATLTSGDNPATATCTAGVWSNANIQCTKCSSYGTTYIQRTSRFFNPPVSFTPSISGGSVTASYCANACNTRTDFVCVAYYYRKSTGSYCVLRPMRVHDNTNHQQYDNADTTYDEYIRECI